MSYISVISMNLQMRPKRILLVPILLMICSCGGPETEKITQTKETLSVPDPFIRVDSWVERRALQRIDGDSESKHLFQKMEGSSIGVQFKNQLKDENIKNYLLSGAGLTVGDFDKNGLPDLFLVSQDGPNKLFRQTTPWKFEDVTVSAGIQDTESWGSGAAFVDIDNDGDLDLFVCNKGNSDEIYMNQGDGTFKGGFVGGSKNSLRAPTMVAFADYDNDGDLDFYRTATRLVQMNEIFDGKVLTQKDENGIVRAHPSQADQFVMIDGLPRELGTYDRLFRNDGLAAGGMPKLVDVTRKSGIKIEREHGLAAVWWDYNDDGWPDLYVSNDFHTPDH